MPDLDPSMLTPDELQMRQQKRRRLILIGAALLVLAAVVIFAARPARDAIKSWQARRHAQKAFVLIDAAKWNDARTEAVAAYQLRTTEPAALRAVARFLSRTRQPQALEFWDQLSKQQALAPEDFRDLASIALLTGETERASAAIKNLLERKEVAPADWFLAAQLALQQNDRADAENDLQKILDAPASSHREQLQAAALRLVLTNGNDSANEQLRAAAIEKLRQLGQGSDDAGLDALVVLAQRQLATAKTPDTGAAPSMDDLIQRLENHPLAKAPQKLLAVDLRIQQSPNEKNALLDSAIEKWKNADDADLLVLATWLNGHGEHERELATIPLAKSLQSRELFLQHVDALGALGRWDEIKRLLDTERFPLDPVIQRMYLARCNAQLGNEAAAQNNWQRALEAATGDPGKLTTLAEYAEKNNATAIAGEAYTKAAADAPKYRPAQQGRLRAAQAARDTARMHAILAEMLPLWPNDTAIQNDEAYTRLLLLPPDPKNPELPTIEKLATDLMNKAPASLPHRTLLALALLREDRAADALKVYEGIQVAPNALTASALAVHAAVLKANGHADDAHNEIEKLPAAALLPEEQALIANL